MRYYYYCYFLIFVLILYIFALYIAINFYQILIDLQFPHKVVTSNHLLKMYNSYTVFPVNG